MQTGIIFDMDGVIVQTERPHWNAWQAVAARRGVTIAYDTFLSCFGRVNDDCIRIMFGADVPPAESARIADEKELAFRNELAAGVPLTPGLVPLLEWLRDSNIPAAVGSSAPPENVNLVLDAGHIRAFFRATVDGSQVTRGKPAPDVFLLAASRLGMPAPRCAVIEDAPAGIRAAVAAGSRAIGLTSTHSRQQLLDAGAHDIIDDIAAAKPLIQRGW
jgi:beta-phosphoglucomutase